MAKKNRSRSAAGAGTIRKKTVCQKGREYTYWEGRYTSGYDLGTGKQIQHSITGKTQKEVAQKLRELTSAIDAGTYQEPCKMTVSEWLDIWAEDYLKGIKASTVHLYKENIRVYIKPLLGAVKLEALDTPMIQHFYNQLETGKDNRPGLSAKTIKNIHGVLHKALQQAVAIGYLRFNPSDACILPRTVRKEIQPLNRQQIIAFLQEIQGHRHQVLYTLALFSGMREGELLGLMWECVDFENNTILVDKQLRRSQEKGGQYYFSPPKSNKSRRVTIAPSVMNLLRLHRQEQARQRLLVGPDWVDSHLVFTNEIGDRLSYRTVYDCFKRIAAKIGCPEARFHDLRHTYAVMALESGDSIKTVQENLGHHAASFTLDVYGHVSDEMRTQSADRMERLLKEITGS